MNLVIDIGNSSTKAAVFDSGEMKDILQSDAFGKKELGNIVTRFPGIRNAIVSSVRDRDPEMMSWMKDAFPFMLILDHKTPLPIQNRYQSRSTLGYDRIAAAVGAWARFPGSDLLVIDAGTAITIDLVTAENTYLGGNISPGTSMRFRALHEFTANLPLVKTEGRPGMMGEDTGSAIRSGVVRGIVFELQGYINEQKKRYPDLKVVMTGGDAKIFEKMLKNTIFMDSNLNLYGLQRILEYNADG